MKTRTYKYYSILENENGQQILWRGRGFNKNNYIDCVNEIFNNTEWKIVETRKDPYKTHREKNQYSMATVDMGQCER